MVTPQERWETIRTRPDWHRRVVGGAWDAMGKQQFDFLVNQGLQPSHYLLDVGCGSPRGGVHFIRYLEPGHYFGIDKSQELLDAGREKEIEPLGLAAKAPTLMQTEEFAFDALNQTFDYALAQSVFTHLPLNPIVRCLMNMERVLRPGGIFFATFFENEQGKRNVNPITWPATDGPDIVSYFDRNPYHYDVATFEWVCLDTTLSVSYVGEWNHPRGQRMLAFTRRQDADSAMH